MIIYNPDDRPSASQVLNHAFFNDLKAAEESNKGDVTISKGIANDNLSQYFKRYSDNALEGRDSVNFCIY